MLHALTFAAVSATTPDARCAVLLRDLRAGVTTATPSGLRYHVRKAGARRLRTGQIAIVSYVLCLPDGRFVDASAKGSTFAFALGERQVVKGFEEAVRRSGLGGTIEAWLPARLGYGRKGSPPVIRPDQDLLFSIQIAGMAQTALSLELKRAFDRGGLPALQSAYAAAQARRFADMYAREDDLNSLGYRFLKKKQTDAAIAVLAYNAQRFPRSWNVYDSLADAYVAAKQFDAAARNYKKALEINPEDQNAIEQLKKLPPISSSP